LRLSTIVEKLKRRNKSISIRCAEKAKEREVEIEGKLKQFETKEKKKE